MCIITPRPGQLTGHRPSGRKQVVAPPSHAYPSRIPKKVDTPKPRDSVKIEREGGVGAANQRPPPFHRGHRYPRRMPATSVEGSGSPIGGPNPESTEDLRLGVLVDSGLGSPIDDLDPSIEVAGVLRGYRRPR
ncbi:hypothetical protein CRG98_005127 [Punica granatum]|uniref:Uncharacterized protein n=1 Tax=Punica granatum TaxID=22663 RepID=A0A2I0L1C0_PUNGR|nr:hypothetical protein CRG98_005127 [Punica granatum]